MHTLIKRIPIEEMPEDYEQVEEFIKESFALKEWQLEEALFEGSASTEGNEEQEQGERIASSHVSFSPSYRHITQEISGSMNAFAVYWTTVWVIIVSTVSFSLVWLPWVRWYVAVALIGLTLITRVASKGLDDLELKLHSHQDAVVVAVEKEEEKEESVAEQKKEKKKESLRKRA